LIKLAVPNVGKQAHFPGCSKEILIVDLSQVIDRR